MWIKTFAEHTKILVKRHKKTRYNPAVIEIMALGTAYLDLKGATKLRDYLNRFIEKQQT